MASTPRLRFCVAWVVVVLCGTHPVGASTPIPRTGEPTTGRPSTGEPTTGIPTTGVPTTGKPGSPVLTGMPSTGWPTSGAPTTGEPTTGVPSTALPPTLVPLTAEPTTGRPTTGYPWLPGSTGQPKTGIPKTAIPNTFIPLTAKPTTGTPTTGTPTTGVPSFVINTAAPTTGGPTSGGPTTGVPTTGEPSTGDPAVGGSTGVPTTGAPTTGVPTTGRPLTGKPGTAAPWATAHPSTGLPTTGVPLTGHPATALPPTLAPETFRPTTGHPTTVHPVLPGGTGVPHTGLPTTRAPPTANPDVPTTPRPTPAPYVPSLTGKPTTGAPTTGAPTTGHPGIPFSTGQPTTGTPTTGHPTTGDPTSAPTPSPTATDQPETQAPTHTLGPTYAPAPPTPLPAGDVVTPQPATGVPNDSDGHVGLGRTPERTLNECNVRCPTCADWTCSHAGQECHDPRPTTVALDDWFCVCVSPSTGSERGRAAICVLDECISSCGSCANETCTGVGQVCRDAAPLPGSLSDWVCECDDGVGNVVANTTAAVTSCVLDECAAGCPTCEQGACAADLQSCEDTAPLADSLSDWECVCPPPYTGRSIAEPVGYCRFDECMAGRGAACVQHGQRCIDRKRLPSSLDDFDCSCVLPARGEQNRGAPASCELDECISECPTCAGTTCSAALQDCVDDDIRAEVLGSWYCLCPPPALGTPVLGQQTACVLDECAHTCTTCADAVCEEEGENCTNVCTEAGQTCFEPSSTLSSTGDWQCLCSPPAQGERLRGVAVCQTDECVEPCPSCSNDTCTAASQDCLDTSFERFGTWLCLCRAPSVGQATRAAAACTLDECNPDTGEGGAVCAAASQTCTDPNQSAQLGDWFCSCAPPGRGTAVGAAAVCSYNECDDCTLVAVEDTEVMILGLLSAPAGSDDACRMMCIENDECWVYAFAAAAPNSGYPEPGTCVLGEGCCYLKNRAPGYEDVEYCPRQVCEWEQQRCSDPSPLLTAMGDWECHCVPPSTGSGNATVAYCLYDECEAPDVASCNSFNQACTDPDPTEATVGDWICVCPPPTSGSAVAGVAWCELDECVAECATCANATCSGVNQSCTDPLTSALDLNSWLCTCADGSLEARGAQAACPGTVTRNDAIPRPEKQPLPGATAAAPTVASASHATAVQPPLRLCILLIVFAVSWPMLLK